VGIEEKLLNLKPLFLDVASGAIWGVGLMKSGFSEFRVFEEERRGWV